MFTRGVPGRFDTAMADEGIIASALSANIYETLVLWNLKK
jgi:hypothetical protein